MSNKSSINIDLDDPRAGKIAEVMSNKTAKAILNALAEKEMTPSDISKELDIPLNTVTYNLQKLVDAGLVGKVKKMFWSSKGKRMEIYKVLNKRIIISPKMMSRKVVASILGVLAILVIALAAFAGQNPEPIPGVYVGNLDEPASFDGVKQFSNYQELENYLEENVGSGGIGGSFGIARNFATDDGFAVEESFAADSAAGAAVPSVASSKSESASDYSETNIQVEGVDEPDIVKNDGKYIYVVQGRKVYVIDAFPAEDMQILDEIEFEDYISNIFINDDKLIVFGNEYEYIDTGIQCGEFFDIGVRCGGYSKQYTNVYVYDMEDRANVELDEKLQFDGNFNDARMVGDFVYVITTKYINLNYLDLPVHVYGGAEHRVLASDVGYFDAPDENYVFTTIAAIEVDSQRVESETYLMSSSSTMYMSEDNIYLTYQKQLSQSYYFEKFVDEVLLEVLPSEERREIREIMDSDASQREKSRDISDIFEDYRRELRGDELESFLIDFSERSEAFYEEIAKQREMSVVHRVEVDEFDIDYEAQGEIPGRILNQFSMDEHDGYFRVATTTGGWNRDRNLNNLYVLDSDLEIVGFVEDLAKGERIYSARFMGDRAFVVTFRQTDPLFAIDLSDPENPMVEGELKITGYSGYLHPYDEDHLIGIGMEADENTGRTSGVKVSLFDISDMENPEEISKYVVNQGTWSSSQAVYDHKAVLFDKEKELLVIPVSYSGPVSENSETGYRRYQHWQGAFVFNVDLQNGVLLKGEIDHEVEKDENEFYYGNQAYVQRSLYMDNVLYTISNLKVKASDLMSLEDISEVETGYDQYPRLYEGRGIAVDQVVF
jgi:inhibitor of cysteine peptidase